MAGLSEYRAAVRDLLASAVDSATWTDALIDAALRRGLRSYDARHIYESDFTVITAGHTQDLAALAADLSEILAVAYPWHPHSDFDRAVVRWRGVGDQVVVLAGFAPQAGEIIRVRHTRRHAIAGLDAAAATTVPDRHCDLVALAGAWWACELRRRQLSENPAVPGEAAALLAEVAAALRRDFFSGLTQIQSGSQPAWVTVGLG